MAMRSQYCGLVTEAQMGETVTLCGWVNRRRDHGGVIFIDLRDREGYVQVVCDPDRAEMFKVAEDVRNEFCVQVKGVVRARPAGTTNDKLKSGQIEVLCHELNVLNASVTPPFQLDDDNLSETVRLTNRVMDLRRPVMQRNMMLRYKTAIQVRNFLDKEGFIDIETPMLGKSTPEGARDYLVPSRVHDGEFFALPQSPQLYKQMLMVSGFDRYYQITKCFRDEDLRADRQPEFTQIDCETSFLNEEEIRAIFQRMIKEVFQTQLNVDLGEFPIMTYQDAAFRFGSDKPDLRVKLEFTELTDIMGDVDFKVFSTPATTKGGRVVALRVPGGAAISRGEIDGYTEFVKIYGAKGLAWIKVNEVAKGREGLQSPIVKNLHDAALTEILKRTGAQDGDLLFFGADKEKIVNDSIGALRLKVGHSEFGKKSGLFEDKWAPLWVVDFPMFEHDEESGRWVAVHHPFTSPKDGHEDLMDTDPGKCIAKAYDMVLNGWELGGGSVRIHRADVQAKVFEALNITPEQQRAKFGYLLDALQYGAPPRRSGLRPGSSDHADDRLRLHPRRDCLPQDTARPGSADPGSLARGREAAARAAHQAAQPHGGHHRGLIAKLPVNSAGRCSHPGASSRKRLALFCCFEIGSCLRLSILRLRWFSI